LDGQRVVPSIGPGLGGALRHAQRGGDRAPSSNPWELRRACLAEHPFPQVGKPAPDHAEEQTNGQRIARAAGVIDHPVGATADRLPYRAEPNESHAVTSSGRSGARRRAGGSAETSEETSTCVTMVVTHAPAPSIGASAGGGQLSPWWC